VIGAKGTDHILDGENAHEIRRISAGRTHSGPQAIERRRDNAGISIAADSRFTDYPVAPRQSATKRNPRDRRNTGARSLSGALRRRAMPANAPS
jgi:hypothetical protein